MIQVGNKVRKIPLIHKKILIFRNENGIMIKLIKRENDAWLSLVERCVRDAEVASSNLVASIPWQGHRKSIMGFRCFLFYL